MSKKGLKVSALLFILVASFAMSSFLVKGEVVTSAQNANIDSAISQTNDTNLKQTLDSRYIELLGLASNITQVDSSIDYLNSTSMTGYSYSGNFTSGNESYTVQSDQFETILESSIISNTTQIISGSTYSYYQEIKNDTTLNGISTINDSFFVNVLNSTGVYQLDMTSSGTLNVDDNTLLSDNSQVYENFAGPVGNYSVQLYPEQDASSQQSNLLSQNSLSSNSESSLIFTIASPDNTITNFTIVPNSSIEQPNLSTTDVSPLDSSSNGPLVNFVVPVTTGFASAMFPQVYSQGSNSLYGFFIYSEGGLELVGLGLIIAALVIGAIDAPETAAASLVAAALAIGEIGTIVGEAHFFPALVNGQTINILYFEFEIGYFSGIPISIYFEMGYYSNQWVVVGAPNSCDWTFFDAFDTSNNLIQINGYPFLNSHTGVWPNAVMISLCSVTFSSLDESNYDSRILNVPFMIDGVVVPETIDYSYGMSPTIEMPEGLHNITAPYFGGALDCMVINGNTYYTNSVNVTISGITAVDAYYHCSVNINLGCCPTLYSMVSNTTDQDFLYSDIGQGATFNTIAPVFVQSDSDHDVYCGVANGTYSVGLVDRPPTDAEWQMNGLQDMQLYAVGYGGNPNAPKLNTSQLIWMVTKQWIYDGQPVGPFISWTRQTAYQNQDKYHNPDEMAGGPVVDSNLQAPPSPYPLPTQTQSYPTGVPNFNDITYFVAQYINSALNDVYNPYADMDANGVINFNDIALFVGNYQQYYNYGDSQPVGVGVDQGLTSEQDNLNQTASLSLEGPSVLPSVGSSFNVTLNVNNVSDLWAWGTGLQWNPGVLNLTGITEGPFLAQGGSTMFLNSLGNSLVQSNGTLQDMGDALFSSSGVSGNGTLATLTFQVLSAAPVNITLTGSELELPYTGDGLQPIACSVGNLQILPPCFITASADSNSSISPSGTVTVNPGANQEFTVAANAGYQIANVVVDGQSVGPVSSYTFSDVTGNHTISVTSTIDTYAVTATSDANSAISPSGTTYVNYGGSQTYTITAATGYRITHVYVDGVDQGAITSYTFSDITASHTISTVSASNIIFSDGFESGSLSKWSLVCGYPSSATPYVTSAEAHTGTYSVCFPGGSDAVGELGTDFTPQTTLDVRFYMNFASLLTAGEMEIGEFDSSNGDAAYLFYNFAGHCFYLDYYSSYSNQQWGSDSSTVQLTANSWFCLELALTPNSYTLYYNGTPIVTVQTHSSSGPFYDITLMSYPIFISNTPTFYIDDVVASNSYIGP